MCQTFYHTKITEYTVNIKTASYAQTFFFNATQLLTLQYKKKIQYSAAAINATYNGVLTRLRYKYVYHLQCIGIFTIRF